MKKIILIMLLAVSNIVAYAQYSVNGVVVDDKGNPVVGAKVSDPKTGVTTITGLDGSFVLSSTQNIKKVGATYVGLGSDEKKAASGMTLRLGSDSWWKEKAKGTFFIGPQALFPTTDASRVVPGIMLGWMKKYGLYMKVFGMPGHEEYNDYTSSQYWYTGKSHLEYASITLGGIVRLGCPLHLYAGYGAVHRKMQYQLQNGEWCSNYHNDYEEQVIDFGLMLKARHLLFNVGSIVYLYEPYDGWGPDFEFINRFTVNVGISYSF